jgi:3-oxoacyl-[acyl-carrier protein] reductase
MSTLTSKSAVVVGASRGIGRGITIALAEAGAEVTAISRTLSDFPVVDRGSIRAEALDAADDDVPGQILNRDRPDIVVLVAGALPNMRPLQDQTWDTFSTHWQADVRISFLWLREILLMPLTPGSRVVVISSGAALAGSALSGGYAGAKATQRFITAYAQDEAKRAKRDITFASVLPRFSPETGVGKPAVSAYATRAAQSVEEYLQSVVKSGGPLVTPEIAGREIVALVQRNPAEVASAYLLSGDGLKALP